MPFPMKAFLVGGAWAPRDAPKLPRSLGVQHKHSGKEKTWVAVPCHNFYIRLRKMDMNEWTQQKKRYSKPMFCEVLESNH